MKAFVTIVIMLICSSLIAGEPLRPNIIWIVADDLGYNDLSCMGQKNFRTPNLDAMANGGMIFQQFYAGCTVCAPSRACFLTGQHTGHVYQRFNGQVEFREDPHDYTIASMLQKSGYKTAMIGKSGLSCNSDDTALPNRKGFEHFFGFISHGEAHRYYPARLVRNGSFVKYEQNKGYVGDVYSGDEFLKESLQWIGENKDSRFFLHLSLQQPHADLQVPDSYRNRFIGEFEETPFSGGHYRAEENPKATFAGMITYLDDSVGKIVKRIQELGIEKNTLIMFTSDNGPHFEGGHSPENFDSNGPLRGGKRDLYEGGIRVPLIAYWPGHIAPRSATNLVSAFWDFPATACELAGIEPPEHTDGISFVPTLLSADSNQRLHEYLYWEFYEQGGKQAVRAGKWKAIRLEVGKNRSGPLELYDLDKDIGETDNVAKRFPEVVKRMEKIMTAQHVPSPVAKFEPARNRKTKFKPGARITTGKTVNRSNWLAVGVDSESKFNGRMIENIFDGNARTFWHTEWKSSSPDHPHEFVLDLGRNQRVTGIRILNRQDGMKNGYIKEFALFLSDNKEFSTPVFTGQLESTRDEQAVKIPTNTARYLKFVTISAFDDRPYASLAEFNLENDQ